MNNLINVEQLLPDSNDVCFVIPALFSAQECEQLLLPELKNSFQKAINNYPTNYRNNDRLLLDDKTLADFLFNKVKPYLPSEIYVDNGIQAENGHWFLSELNSRIRYCKYSANQYFNRHLDGVHYSSETKQSKLTFMIYLNDAADFEGGRTLFYKSKDTTEIWASYIPRQGDLIVFDHNIWHEGEVLKSGEKFVLRSDILYSKINAQSSRLPFTAHLGYIWKILSFDSNTILSAGRDKLIHVWDTNGTLLQSLNGHHNSIICLEKINDTTFISGSRDKQILIWKKNNLGLFELSQSCQWHTAIVLSLCKINESLFISSSGDNTIKLNDLNGSTLNVFHEHKDWVWQVIQLSTFIFASCSEDASLKIWDYRLNKSLVTIQLDLPVISLIYNPECNQLICGNLIGEIIILDLDADHNVINTKKWKAHEGIIRSLLCYKDKHLITAGEDNKVKIWHIDTATSKKQMEHLNFVQSLALINENLLLSASYDGTIHSWPIDIDSI